MYKTQKSHKTSTYTVDKRLEIERNKRRLNCHNRKYQIIPFLNKINGWQNENEEVNLQEEMKAVHHWIVWMIGSDIIPTMPIHTFWWISFVVKFYSFSLCKTSFIHHTENMYPAFYYIWIQPLHTETFYALQKYSFTWLSWGLK